MSKLRERILKEASEAKCEGYRDYRDLIEFCVCDDYFGYNADEEESDFDEVFVVVAKDWLFALIKQTKGFRTDNEVRKFLQEEYTSDDSSIWYEEAIKANQVVMIDFN